MKRLPRIATVLLIIGGINWGLIGFFQYDLVAALFGGQGAALSRLIYALVGISALYQLFDFPRRYKSEISDRGVAPTERIDRAA